MKKENKNEYGYEYELELQKRLKRQLREHRIKLNLRQVDVAKAVGNTISTYQRWESPDHSLTNIFNILSAFRALDFSTTEIIDVLGLPPLTSSEIKVICQHEDMVQSIKENGIYSAVRKKCPDIDDFTLEKLLELLLKERIKRLESRHGNP